MAFACLPQLPQHSQPFPPAVPLSVAGVWAGPHYRRWPLHFLGGFSGWGRLRTWHPRFQGPVKWATTYCRKVSTHFCHWGCDCRCWRSAPHSHSSRGQAGQSTQGSSQTALSWTFQCEHLPHFGTFWMCCSFSKYIVAVHTCWCWMCTSGAHWAHH